MLELAPGITVFQGANAQGKSNLLEAAYLLAIAKSPRTSTDRELLRREVLQTGGHAQVVGIAREREQTVQAQIDFEVTVPRQGDGNNGQRPAAHVQKTLRVNGVPRSAAEFVGAINVVAFAAEDLGLVYGPPSVRRRYLDILISQSDRAYLKALQRYGRVVTQRNHLLRALRDGRAGRDELDFWDQRLVEAGAAVVERRERAVAQLAEEAAPLHAGFSGGQESLGIAYRPRLASDAGTNDDGAAEQAGSVRDLEAALREGLEAVRQRELAQGISVIGPHRDEVVLTLNGEPAGPYASRGQARSIALALRLAEGSFVTAATGRSPVLALDDVLSELDEERRGLVLERAAGYEQVLLTTTDFDRVAKPFLRDAGRMIVSDGTVTDAAG